jgi:hypothetical protein
MRTACSVLALLLSACGPKLVVQDVFESADRDVKVTLRHTVAGGEPVPRGYDQPVTISDVRIAHILAQITHLDADEVSRPTISSVHVYPLAEGVSKALAVAGPDDEVIAVAFTRERRFGIFTYDEVTSFRVTMDEPMLNVDFFMVGERLEKDPKRRNERIYEVPPELPDRAPSFRIKPTKIQIPRGRRGVAFVWRDPYYARPVSLSLRGGRIKRRTILMEAEPEELRPDGFDATHSPVLRDAQLRALDRLDASRRNGEVQEDEFLRRRRLILEGRLEKAGYGDLEPGSEP